MAWKQNKSKWGWKEVVFNSFKLLIPRFTNISMIPEELLKKISYRCETNCSSNKCGCRKHGLKSIDLCTQCRYWDNCSNVEKISEDFNDSEDITPEFEQSSISLNPENQQSSNLLILKKLLKMKNKFTLMKSLACP